MVPNSGQQRPGVGGGKGESAERDLPGLRGIFGLPIRKDLIFKATELRIPGGDPSMRAPRNTARVCANASTSASRGAVSIYTRHSPSAG